MTFALYADLVLERLGVSGVEVAVTLFLTVKVQANIIGRTITMLFNEDFGNAFLVGFGVVIFFAVNEGHDIGILLDGARFADVGKLRAFIRATFY